MKFKSNKQRKAVMAKLRAGSTIIYSYERKRNDVYGNPRNKAYNISVLKRGDVEKLIPEIDIGYRSEEQAVFEELQKKGYIPKTRKVEPVLSTDEREKLRKIYYDESRPVKERREALNKMSRSGRTNYFDLKSRYKFRRI